MTERFRVGVIAGTHGIRGDVRIFPTTDEPARFKKLKSVFIDNIKGQTVQVGISGARVQGKFVIAHLEGYDTPETAMALHGKELLIDRSDALPLAEGQYYIPDLIGMRVMTDDGKALGILEDVLETGANDVYEVRLDEGGEVLIPKIPDCIISVSPENNQMVVHLLPGLLEANRP